MIALALLVAWSTLPQTSTWPTLAEELAKHEVPSAQIDDRDRRITSYEVYDEGEWFAIAYYWDAASLDLLRFGVYNRRVRGWKSTTLPGDWGSITRVNRSEQWWYVSGHWSPSAAPTLVLSTDLKVRRALKGWPELILRDGRVVYQNNMPHFSPAYPGSLSVYDPRADRDARLFPVKPDIARGNLWMDRTISDVQRIGTGVAFNAVEQRVRAVENRGAPDGPSRQLHITCDLDTLKCATAAARGK
jgi:hypothetical protein